jgi:glycosyltransferase involved in cell wall biosynthesis
VSPPEVSVVIPVYDEEESIERTIDAVRAQLRPAVGEFEIVTVDDGSRDGTLARLQSISRADEHVRVIQLTRNFGKEAALAAGLDAARGRAVIVMDADLQHPAEVIPRMVELWRQGYEVVSAVKEGRAREGLTYRAMAKLFNVLMGGAAGSSFKGASDFKLLDRQVIDALADCPERNRFFRALVTWVGFRTVEVPFTVQDRSAGRTKWSTLGLVRYSLRNLIAYSSLPLRVVAAAGFITLLFAAGLAVEALWRYLSGHALTGFTTVILLQLILGGLLLTSVGVIAVYVAEIYDEVKKRPVFLVRKRASGVDRASAEVPVQRA